MPNARIQDCQARPDSHARPDRPRPGSPRLAALALMWLLALGAGLLSLAPGSAHAAQPAGGTVLRVIATATYIPTGLTQTETVSSNLLTVSVASVESLTLTQDQALTMPVYEILSINDELADLIASDARRAELRKAAERNGFRDIEFCARRRVADGMTTSDEIVRSLGVGP